MTAEDRCDVRENGIFVCASCHTLLDKPKSADEFPVEMLKKLKQEAEKRDNLPKQAIAVAVGVGQQTGFQRISNDFTKPQAVPLPPIPKSSAKITVGKGVGEQESDNIHNSF